MTAKKKKEVLTLVALVVVLIGLAGYTFWPYLSSSSSKAASPAEKLARVTSLPNLGNARILPFDQMPSKDAVGKKNIFQYYVPPPPPPKPPPPKPPPPQPPPPQPPPPPPPPPAPQWPPFKFDAVGISATPGKLMASIGNGTTDRFNVTEGEYIMGRFRVVKITMTSIEMEDASLTLPRKTFPRATQ